MEDIVDPDAVELLRPGTISTIADILQLEFDATKGQALILNVDCTLQPSAGITISSDPADDDTVILYIDGDLPDPNLDATIDTGNSGVFNIPVGFTTFTNVRAETGQRISSSVVYIRGGYLTYINMPPTSDLPTEVGKYKIIAKLGQGGMAQVLLCLSHGPGGFNKLVLRSTSFIAM